MRTSKQERSILTPFLLSDATNCYVVPCKIICIDFSNWVFLADPIERNSGDYESSKVALGSSYRTDRITKSNSFGEFKIQNLSVQTFELCGVWNENV